MLLGLLQCLLSQVHGLLGRLGLLLDLLISLPGPLPGLLQGLLGLLLILFLHRLLGFLQRLLGFLQMVLLQHHRFLLGLLHGLLGLLQDLLDPLLLRTLVLLRLANHHSLSLIGFHHQFAVEGTRQHLRRQAALVRRDEGWKRRIRLFELIKCTNFSLDSRRHDQRRECQYE